MSIAIGMSVAVDTSTAIVMSTAVAMSISVAMFITVAMSMAVAMSISATKNIMLAFISLLCSCCLAYAYISISMFLYSYSGLCVARSAKSSLSSVPVYGDGHSVEEGAVFYAGSDPSTPLEQDSNAEIYEDLHNKLNWLTVRCIT